MLTNNIHRRFLFARHPALAMTHICRTDRPEDDRESLCGGRSCGWIPCEVKPGDTRGGLPDVRTPARGAGSHPRAHRRQHGGRAVVGRASEKGTGLMRADVLQGDAIEKLRTLPDRCVHTCVTSPPYYALRDYNTGTWEGGDPECDHKARGGGIKQGIQGRAAGEPIPESDRYAYSEKVFHGACGKCGAVRVDNQLGLEDVLDCGMYGAGLVELRSDLSEEEKMYVIRELMKHGLL